jgi:hypothetical protein
MLQAYVPSVLSVFSRCSLQVCLFGYCICFAHMLHMFRTYVVSVLSEYCLCFTMVFKCFYMCFASVSDTYFKCFICLQMYVASVQSGCFKSSRVLHLPSRFLLSRHGVSFSRHRLASTTHPPLFSMLVTFRMARARVGTQKRAENDCMHGRPNAALVQTFGR